ncbi:MAG: PEP/pyruvate-binding domain-containing protein, partial [Methylocella sp.]
MQRYVVDFATLSTADVAEVGGKNASLGEMIAKLTGTGVRVPPGFATTAGAFREFLADGGLDERIRAALDALDVDDVRALAKTGAAIRQWILEAPFAQRLEQAVGAAYGELPGDAPVAVRSSATAEDLPEASFAGQQETYLNVQGLGNVLHAVKRVFASLYNDRAIAYR